MRYTISIRIGVCVGGEEGVYVCICVRFILLQKREKKLGASCCGGAQTICLFFIPLPFVLSTIPIQYQDCLDIFFALNLFRVSCSFMLIDIVRDRPRQSRLRSKRSVTPSRPGATTSPTWTTVKRSRSSCTTTTGRCTTLVSFCSRRV